MPRKATYAAVGSALVVALVLGGAALGISDDARLQAIEAIKWMAMLLIGGHALTDIASNRAGK